MHQSHDWRNQLPTLVGHSATLRELRRSDAPALLASVSSDAVTRFVSEPPLSVEGVERFVAWTHRQRAAGGGACFGIVPAGHADVAGLAQIWRLDSTFTAADYGFALAAEFWGNGIFEEGTRLLLSFVGPVLGVRRLEAWVCEENARALRALAKVHATRHESIRRPFTKADRHHEQALWALNVDEWRAPDVSRRNAEALGR